MEKFGDSRARRLTPRGSALVPRVPGRLLADVRELIEAARQGVAQTVNAAMVTLNWHIGSADPARHFRRAAGRSMGDELLRHCRNN